MIDNSAAEQKKQNDLIDLVNGVLNENNSFNDQVKIEDKYIEDNLLGDTNSKNIK